MKFYPVDVPYYLMGSTTGNSTDCPYAHEPRSAMSKRFEDTSFNRQLENDQ